jgi:NTE family protein
VLQGGGALGAYQAGVYEGCTKPASGRTGWPAFRSARSTRAIIAGSPEIPARRPSARILGNDLRLPVEWPPAKGLAEGLPFAIRICARSSNARGDARLVQGQNGFFKPRFPPPLLSTVLGRCCDQLLRHRPLRDTLERLVDFDR